MKPRTRFHRALWLGLLAGLGMVAALFVACSGTSNPDVTPTPTRTPRPTPTLTPSPTPTPAWPVTVFVPLGLPAPAADALHTTLAAHPDLFALVPSADAADVQVVLSAPAVASTANTAESGGTGAGPGPTPLAEWVYAVVAPFPTLTDEVAWADVASSWSGTPAGPFAGRPLMMAAETATTLSAVMGDPAPGVVEVLPSEEILQRAWDAVAAGPGAQGAAWAIVPFEALEPRWKVLRLDGAVVLDKELDVETYPLAVRVELTGLGRGVAKLQEQASVSLTNRDPAKMSVVAMTGVTALARATAMRMERSGVTYPAQDIRPWLVNADITHVSNEVSFAENCPPPANYTTMVFCSSPRYIELFEDTDVDVVELTGNHLLDWGLEAMALSLSMYDERSIPYFGGGWNLAQAQTPLTLTHGVHTFGFVGCNPVGPASNWATEELPGAAPCDYDLLTAQIQELRQQGVIPIVTLQYWEFYQYEPTPQQRTDFRALAEAGAAIVSGSQAHQPQGFDFHAGAFIHYGLGNLFFDQMWSLETRQEFVDWHVFYDGRHISTQVLTAILEDYARPRPMTPEEREALLTAAFEASGW